jgi:hypothetical protein
MTTTPRSQAPLTSGGLPYDLSVWVDKSTLVKMTLEVTTQFASLVSRNATPGCSPSDLPPAMLLTLMTYCYATGAYASSEIERRSNQDDIVRYITANSQPDRHSLRAFRRRWRVVIRECLVNLSALLWQRRYAGDSPGTRGLEGDASPRRSTNLPPETLRLLVCEADRRIDRAVQYDSMELDE